MQIPPRVSALGGDYALLGGSTFSCDLTALAKNCEKMQINCILVLFFKGDESNTKVQFALRLGKIAFMAEMPNKF